MLLRTIALVFLLAAAVSAQTKTDTTQIAAPSVTAPSVFVVLPGGVLGVLKLEGFIVDVTAGIPSIRPAVVTAPKITHEKLAVSAATGAPTTSPIPPGCSLVMVIRNIPMHPGVDYDATATTITWRPVSLPTATDQVSALCQR